MRTGHGVPPYGSASGSAASWVVAKATVAAPAVRPAQAGGGPGAADLPRGRDGSAVGPARVGPFGP
uniref:Uncharacterized protein n=1 Tax=Streptomyces avermitilis TaxID=33903 RepID=A0A499VKS5_STRAX|nr:hypothetical protein SAVMC3_77020 [Streptomyces avermitilis]